MPLAVVVAVAVVVAPVATFAMGDESITNNINSISSDSSNSNIGAISNSSGSSIGGCINNGG